MLEQIAYQIPRIQEERQVVYQVGDLEELSASALYYGTGGGSIGSSGFLTILRIDNVARIDPLDKGEGIPTSPNSFGYFSATFKPLGSLEQLNFEEMSILLNKYSKK